MSDGLVRIGELSRRAGVSVATIKHYLREGLIAASRKSGRTMSWYDPALVGRIQAIKELQQTRFLPLEVIRESINRAAAAGDDLAAAEAIAGVLARRGGGRSRSRAEVIAHGGSAAELDWLAAAGLARPSARDGRYRGDDLALLQTLGAARRAGLSAEMLPFEILGEYLAAIRALVAVELRMFRAGVVGKGHGRQVARLTAVATQLSERLVVLIRRRLLVPTLRAMTAAAATAAAATTSAAAKSTGAKPSPTARAAARKPRKPARKRAR